LSTVAVRHSERCNASILLAELMSTMVIGDDKKRPGPVNKTILLIVFACLSVASAEAQSSARKVAIVEFDQTLEQAIRAALEPWNLQIVTAPGPSPGATAPRANEIARELAEESGVDAVVWISEYEQGYALWIYDVETDNIVERPISRPPPFDEATAAAVALSAKTLLRHSATAPAPERFGAAPPAEPAPPAAPPPNPPPPPPKPAPPRQHVEIGPPYLELENVVAIRGSRTRPSYYEPRLGLGLAWWPNARWFALAAGVSMGTGLHIARESFQGSLIDSEAVITARACGKLGANFQVSTAAGPALQLTWLDGTVLPDRQPAQVWRAVPSVHGQLQADWQVVPWLRLGLRGAGLWNPRTQRYEVEGIPVLTVSRFAFDIGLVLGLSILNSRIISYI
jgi:hypothetical protein